MKNMLLILGLITIFSAQAQFDDQGRLSKEYKKNFSTAIGSWYDQDYNSALEKFKALSLQFPGNSYFKFLIGDCLLELSEIKKSIPFLEVASDSLIAEMTFFDYQNPRNTKAPFTAVKRLGIAYRTNYEFNKAIDQFETYKKLHGESFEADEKKEERTDIEKELSICENGIQLVSNPVKIKVATVGANVNSKFPEYAPVISADEKTLIFTSRRGQGGDKKDGFDYLFYEDIYISEKSDGGKWKSPKKISDNINSSGHEASIGLSVDGQQLLIYSSQEDPDGDIYLSTLDGDVWSRPIPFLQINSKSAETHACFNVDGTAVFFTSNREEDNYGGFDIYKINKLPDGTWSLPINLGPTINTKYDETAPFIHPDGVTLYFSSNGHKTMGGYDIFKSTINQETYSWTNPENIGYPINTTGDDVFYVTSVDGNRAYYASEKSDGQGEKDLYIITSLDKKKKSKALTVMTGVFSMGNNEEIPEDAQITVKDAESGEILGIYRPNAKTGKYLFILPPGKTYDVSYEVEGYLFKSENLIVPTSSSFAQINKEINLAPIKANESIVLNNVFFQYDSDKIIKESLPDLEKLAKLLNKNKSIIIEISGHTDSKGKDAYNLRLSEKRAKSVREYLIKNGVTPNRITAVGKGELHPIARNSNPDGSDNPEGRQLNRRIELKVLANDGVKTTVDKISVPDELKEK
ncbi:MAG: outer membrane protein OmpA-like peptidoglycan-associated protein [Saprospiraceae bacterium]|jgi:outer membrane protein OmpA-like peptidoglycan-associated protein